MSTLSHPDKQGNQMVHLGGELLGTIWPNKKSFKYLSADGKHEGYTRQRSLSIKSLVTYFRSL